MTFIADLHLHSKYSRATAKNLDFAHLYISAQIKGITVLGTADFTHPAWWQAIEEELEPAEDGLFALKPEVAGACDAQVPAACRAPVRFMLVSEISNIYKKDQRTRKNHNLVFMPDLESAGRLRQRLDRIGNITADGRPILGLDARDLLEIVLDCSDQGYLIPAHVWTPWFSLLGSKSGFDSVQECFGDLSEHIFALETGLSSDPPMNWRVSSLDRYTLVSNSDAHSPAKLGREANRFDTELSYGAMRAALEQPSRGGFKGTIEFFPEEGKYHLDGHRKCGFRSLPEKTRDLGDRCPVCGREMTLGVLYRVEALADRPPGFQPRQALPYTNLIPLEDVLAEVYQVGPASKKVARAYEQLVNSHGAEFDILEKLPPDLLDRSGIPLLGTAMARMRAGQVVFDPGFDGEFGKVRLFKADERTQLAGQQSLFAVPEQTGNPKPDEPKQVKTAEDRPVLVLEVQEASPAPADDAPTLRLNPEQQACVDHAGGPMMILAGPGTGKTRTITCRMAHLIDKKRVAAGSILAVTFTNQAAREMAQRLKTMLGDAGALPLAATFHGLCRQLLQEAGDQEPLAVADEEARQAILSDALHQVRQDGRTITLTSQSVLEAIIQAKQKLAGPDDDLASALQDLYPDQDPDRDTVHQIRTVYAAYQDLLTLQHLMDFEDLILQSVQLLEKDKAFRKAQQRRFTYLFVDEFQDINFGQYRLIRLLAPPDGRICVIGDPDQAIYGFRGSDVRYFTRFSRDFPKTRIYQLNRNYRSTQTILEASAQVIQGHRIELGPERAHTLSNLSGVPHISLSPAPSAAAEAVAIGRTIEQMVGGTGFHAVDFGKTGDSGTSRGYSFADMAVLFRTRDQGRFLYDALTRAGLPCQLASREDWRSRPVVARLLALLRVLTDQGSYADLNLVRDIITPTAGVETLTLFRTWCYRKQLPLATAMHTAQRLPIPGLTTHRQYNLVALIRKLKGLRRDASGLPLPQAIARLAEQTGMGSPEHEGDIALLQDIAASHGDDVAGFLSAHALGRDTDLYRPGVERIALLTLHAAKGLEFPVVFIAGCEDGLIPYRRNSQEPADREAGDPEEERRLFYVAMTRAKEQIFCTWARRRSLHGKTGDRKPSPYLDAIAAQLKQQVEGNPQARVNKQEQLSLF